MREAERAEEFTRFGVSCSAKKVYGVQGTAVPEHREDVKIMAERGGECEEYREMIDFVKSGKEVKDTSSDHPARAHASMMSEMGVEETDKGPLLLVGGIGYSFLGGRGSVWLTCYILLTWGRGVWWRRLAGSGIGMGVVY